MYCAMRMSSITVSHKNTIRNLFRFSDEKVSYARAIFKSYCFVREIISSKDMPPSKSRAKICCALKNSDFLIYQKITDFKLQFSDSKKVYIFK